MLLWENLSLQRAVQSHRPSPGLREPLQSPRLEIPRVPQGRAGGRAEVTVCLLACSL